jgi:hypothetical protein
MATKDHTVFGDPCWIDLMTSEVQKSREFYSSLFGWEAGEPSEEFGGYFMFMRDGQPIAGAMGNQMVGSVPDMWSTYFAVENADDSVALAQSAGANVFAEAMQVGNLGTMAVMLDPSGAGFGIWAPNEFQGFVVIDEPNTPRWFEQHSRGYDEAVAFYSKLFGWDARVMSDSPDFRYTTANHGDQSFAGIMDATGHLPEGAAPHWQIYFGVEHADATVATALELGGSVLAPAQDTPYGRLATITDSTGAVFSIMQ